jgi:ring-1,2-phenylacetyl-CoA epoxidase subunit PaaB
VIREADAVETKAPLDQFGTYEVFVQPKEGKPFQHEGIVHSPDLELAYVLAKETFTRRFTCTSLYVADTRHVLVSALSENNQNIYDSIHHAEPQSETKISFEVYHLMKRGKQHVHVGSVTASDPVHALDLSRQFSQGKMVYNVWVIQTDKIRFTSPEEKDLWITLPEKKFRDASDYKGGDKLKEFLQRTKAD